jgi:hypothetical protein
MFFLLSPMLSLQQNGKQEGRTDSAQAVEAGVGVGVGGWGQCSHIN